MLRHFLNDLRVSLNGCSKARGNLAVNPCAFFGRGQVFGRRQVGEGVKLARTPTNVKRILGTTAAQETAEIAILTWHVERLFHWGQDL